VKQYLDLCKRTISEGVWVTNKRTGAKCLTIINADMEYDCSQDRVPLLTTKKMYWKGAVAEMLGYLRGYDSAKQFRDIGCNTWNANANENEAWIKNPFRKGEDDMGRVYGAVARNYGGLDLVKQAYDKLCNKNDDRDVTITFYKPDEFDKGCLRPCMHTHTFSLVRGVLHLTSYQRSADLALGVPFNMLQTAWLLRIMAQITGNIPGKVFHKLVNVHIYENQLEPLLEQIKRKPKQSPKLIINPFILSLEDLEKGMIIDRDNEIVEYSYHPAIKFPFTV
jgi:thymidylate synthase